VIDKFLDKQYIASINQNKLNTLSNDTKKFIEKNTVQELTDESDNGKLSS
jgi:Fe-S cluster biosynthesis and repair protein YggX